MGNLHIIKQYIIFYFCGVPDHTVLTDQRIAADKGSRPYLSACPDDSRTINLRSSCDHSRFCDPDIIANPVKFFLGKFRARL